MIQTLITMAIAIGIGAFVTGKDLIQRRGSWRFALDHVLFAEIFYQQVQNEANIKVR